MHQFALWPLLVAMAAVIAANTVACPLWMSASGMESDASGMGNDPHSDEHNVPDSCPPSICVAASPYIVAQFRADELPPLQEYPAEAPEAARLSSVPVTVVSPQGDWIPPPESSDPLFLRLRVLLI